jgi:two-component system, LytTR family, response regulator
MPIRTVIVDDESSGAENLQLLVKEYCPELEIVGIFNSCNEAKKLMLALQPDLIFLDIELGDGSGFDLVKTAALVKAEIIFTTAYNEFAIRAIKANAIDYLLKPLDVEELVTGVKKACARISERMPLENGNEEKKITRLSIPSVDSITYIELSMVTHLESNSNYTIIYLNDNKKHTVSKTLGEYEEMLSGTDFFRIHHQYIANLKYTEKYIKGDGGQLVLKDKITLPVSRAKKQELLDRLSNKLTE